ncbi:MAG TPA: hypothetical protein VEA44_04810 [Caulobacter sp.]|nr:hypothetical protein [Caulobacter sp.]
MSLPTRLAMAAVTGLVLFGGAAMAADALTYRAAIREADASCADRAVQTALEKRFRKPTRSGYQQPHVFLATRLTKAESTAGNHLHRALRATLGPLLVSRREAAGAFCALAPRRELRL